MERVQRVLGRFIAGFCLLLLVSNPFGRASVGEPPFILTDIITLVVMFASLASSVWPGKWGRVLQVSCFVAAGVGALASMSQTVGLVVLNAGFFLALFYGWYKTKPIPKVIGTSALFFAVVYVFDKATTNNNLVATVNWMLLFIGLSLFFWFLYSSRMKEALLVAKSYKNELDKKECGDAT